MSMAVVAAVAPVVVGGILGSQGTTTQQTSNKTLPDFLQPFVTGANGSGGLLGDAQALYQKNAATGGLNPLQMAGMEAQRQWLTSPQYLQGFGQMLNKGMDLMGRPVAGNPFASGNTGGLGGYGSLSAPGAGGQPSTPASQGSSFNYSANPTLLGAMSPLTAPTAAPAPAPANPTQLSQDAINQIIAQLGLQAPPANGGQSGAGPQPQF